MARLVNFEKAIESFILICGYDFVCRQSLKTATIVKYSGNVSIIVFKNAHDLYNHSIPFETNFHAIRNVKPQIGSENNQADFPKKWGGRHFFILFRS